MIVVIVVSRRVGQVTLAVSERTSCRNLNGLKAIAVPRPLGDECHVKGKPDARASQKNYRPNPLFKKEKPKQRARLFGDFNCRAGYPPLSDGPAAGGGYLLPYAPKVKVGCGEIKGLAGKKLISKGLGWQEWQGSNLRPPVLETGALPIELHSFGTEAVPRSAPFQA